MKGRSLQFRFLMTVMSAILAVTIFVGGFSIYEVDNYIQKETKTLIEVTCENHATKINQTFQSMEKSVRIMENYTLSFFQNTLEISKTKPLILQAKCSLTSPRTQMVQSHIICV